MKLKGAVTVNASQEEVWRILMDPAQFCKVMPGCEKARQLDDTHYEAILAVKVPLMTIRSKAKGTILEAQAPRHLVGELAGEPRSVSGSFRNRVCNGNHYAWPAGSCGRDGYPTHCQPLLKGIY